MSNCQKNAKVIFTSVEAKEALAELIDKINGEARMKQIKENYANDMVKYIQNFMPYAMEVQYKVIAKYGFTSDNDGLMCFTNRLKELAVEDDGIANLFEDFKTLLVPPLNLRTQCV